MEEKPGMEGMALKIQNSKFRVKNSKVLVTGGAGFIGSHLVKKLHSLDFHVVVVDVAVNPRSLFAIERLHKKSTLIKTDIRDREKVFTLFKKYKPDFIFHLAAEPIVENAYKNPYETFDTNVMGTVNILDAARTIKNLKGVIVASSDKAYGKTKIAYSENSPLAGDHPYDVSKSCEDLIAYTYFKTYGLPVTITRFGNVYGEGDFHTGRIIPDICDAVNKKKTLLIRSDGSYVRDYLYVADVVNGYIFLMKNMKKAIGQAYNFSSRDTLSVMQLIKKAEKVLNKKIRYKILNTAKNEIPYQHLDDRKIRKLGWKSSYQLSDVLKQVAGWYKKTV